MARQKTPGEYSDWWLVRNEVGGAYLRESDLRALPVHHYGYERIPVPEGEMEKIPWSARLVWRSQLGITAQLSGWRLIREQARAFWHRLFHPLPLGPAWATQRFCLRCGRYYRMPAGIANSELAR
jgi:hypothetical protein